MKTLKQRFVGKANKLFFVTACLVLVGLGLVAVHMAWQLELIADANLQQATQPMIPAS